MNDNCYWRTVRYFLSGRQTKNFLENWRWLGDGVGLFWVFLEKTVQHNCLYLTIFLKSVCSLLFILCLKKFPESLLPTALVCVYINKQNHYLYLFIKERRQSHHKRYKTLQIKNKLHLRHSSSNLWGSRNTLSTQIQNLWV